MIVRALELEYEGKTASFPDVRKGDEMSPYIAVLEEIGAVRGFTDGTYRSNQAITRRQIAQIVAIAFKLEPEAEPVKFTDVNYDRDSASQYIDLLASNGIVQGYGDGTYRPNDNTTRAQFAKTISRCLAMR